MHRLILLMICCFVSIVSFGQHYYFKNYSLQEGLSRSGVYYILQDNKGFLWIGTEGGGISKFDGHEFTNYSSKDGLQSDHIRVIFEDENGVLWFGTDNGLSFFEYGDIKTLTTENGLSDNFIRSITQDNKGNLWVGSNKGISIIDPSEKEISSKLKVNFNLPHKKVRSLLADSSKVWIGTDAGLCKIENGHLSVFNQKDGLANNLVLSIYIDSKSQLWIGTNEGLSKYSNGTFESWTEKDGLINNRIRTICEDASGHMWFGTKKGISILYNNEFINLDIDNGLSNERIRCIQKDRFGDIWIGTYFGGIMRFNYRDFIGFSTKNGLPSNQIFSISENEKGELIIGSFDGASLLKTESELLHSQPDIKNIHELSKQSINTIYKGNQGTFLYGTNSGLVITNVGKTIIIDEGSGLVGRSVRAIFQKDTIYYVGTELGLNEIKFNHTFDNFKVKAITKNDGLAGNIVSFIDEDKEGQIWIGFLDGQISILVNDQLINPKLDKGIKLFSSIAFDHFGNSWLGTNGLGLYQSQYNHQTKTLSVKQYSLNEGLSSNAIFSLLFHDEKLWVAHEKGIDLISFNDSTSVNKINHFGLENGFLGLQNNMNASYVDSKGNLWFGTVNGLYCLSDNAEKLSHHARQSINYIQSVKINNQTVDWAESDYCQGIEGIFDLPVDLELPYNINTISFDFVGLNFVVPKKVKFSWRLKGFESGFRSLVNQSNCDYTNLEPGKYTFQLKSTNENGEIIEELEEFSFIIKKPFWQTWGFRIFAILVVVGLLIWYLDFRTKQLLTKQKKLEDTIATRTEEIVYQNKELEQKNAEIEIQHDELADKNKEITDSILYSRRIQRSLLPSFEKMKSAFIDHFVLYTPKDIVSGDFYWVAEPVKGKNKKVYFAVADCTGHGVPGAMVSLICTRALNSSLLEHKLRKPKDILEKTNAIVLDAFTDQETGAIIKDGMDIALGLLDYSVDKNSAQFSFSGAHNSAWIILPDTFDQLTVDGNTFESNLEGEDHKLYILSGTKQPIGDFDKRVPFPQQTCHLPKGARIYLYTDGYADQFGGKSAEDIAAGGKKFKYKPLKNLILSIQNLPLSQQQSILTDEFNTWKQDLEQVDDVCIMCVEV